MLQSLGHAQVDEQWVIDTLGAGEVNANVGLCRGDHSGLREIIYTPMGYQPESVWIESFDHLYALASTRAPLQLSGAKWYHHCAVRGVRGDRVWIANSAPGYRNVFELLDRAQFDALGSWRATWVRDPAAIPQPGTAGGAWDFWSAVEIAEASGCPVEAVRANWPALYQELAARGIATRETCAACIATVSVETARTFQPVEEAFWLDDAWRNANLRYAPWWGRGYVQLTWESNYQAASQRLGIDLTSDPRVALQPEVAAAIMADFFAEHGIHRAADQQDWTEVRRLVQGADAGLDHLLQVLTGLGFG